MNIMTLYREVKGLDKNFVLIQTQSLFPRIGIRGLIDLNPTNLQESIQEHVHNICKAIDLALYRPEVNYPLTLNIRCAVNEHVIHLDGLQILDLSDKESTMKKLSEKLSEKIAIQCISTTQFKQQHICYCSDCANRNDNPLHIA